MKSIFTNKKGITLIALVVTIIVLLILAGISIMMLTGQNGILIRAQEAGTNTAHAEVYETLNLESAEYMTESRIGEYGGSLIDYLLDEEYIKETDEEGKYLINVEKLLGTKGKYGNGTDGKNDVYKLEEEKQTSTIGKVATKELVKIGETETSKTYDVIYYEKEGKEGKLLGKLYDGDASATTTTTSKENLEDMYYLNGEYNGETGIIENIRLGFLPTMLEKIVEENMTEKDLLLRAAINIGYTTANTFEDYMEEIYTRSKTRYTTAKGFMMGYYNCSEEDYRYSDLISNLRNEYDKEENMTEEELILKWAVEECEITTASTFEEYMEEIYNQKKFTTPREYFKKYIGEVSVTYDDYISFLKFNVTYNELTIEDSNGNTIRRDPDYSIEGIGQYTFKIKLDNKILKTINVSIDQYEIIRCEANINDEWSEGIVAYDFQNEKILTIDGGEYVYKIEGESEKTKSLEREEIDYVEDIGSFIKPNVNIHYYETLYRFNLRSNDVVINGYQYEVGAK